MAMFIIHQWIRLNELYKLIESCYLQTYGKLFFKFRIYFNEKQGSNIDQILLCKI